MNTYLALQGRGVSQDQDVCSSIHFRNPTLSYQSQKINVTWDPFVYSNNVTLHLNNLSVDTTSSPITLNTNELLFS